jgi:hypothetical protein
MANRAINNPDLYIDHEDFFNLAQDIGFEMTDEEKAKARPKKLCHIAYDGWWYKDMYTLSRKIYLHYNEREEGGSIHKDSIESIEPDQENCRFNSTKATSHESW